MGLLAPLAALLGLETEKLMTKARAAALAYGTIGLLLLVAAIFLIAAGFMSLAQIIGPVLAALALAGIFLLLALIVYLGMLIGRGRQRREQTERRHASETGALLTSAAITALPMVMRSPVVLRVGLPLAALAYILMRRSEAEDR